MSPGRSLFVVLLLPSAHALRDEDGAAQGAILIQMKADRRGAVTSKPPALVSVGGHEQQRQRSLQLSEAFARAARSSAPSAAASSDLWESFRVCGQCRRFVRLGEDNDGGYLTCADGIAAGQVSAAYSMGVALHDQWSEDVARWLKVPVNQFDCTVDASACAACSFHKRCIVAADGQHPVPGHEEEGWSLAEALAHTSQAGAADGSLLMKMDIESSEWPIFATEPPAALRKFAQLIVEFHGLGRAEQHPLYLRAMRRILGAGFRVAHLHGNNCCPMLHPDAAHSVPSTVEVTFVRGGARPGGCAPAEIREGLDAPNLPSRDELPLARFG